MKLIGTDTNSKMWTINLIINQYMWCLTTLEPQQYIRGNAVLQINYVYYECGNWSRQAILS